MASLFPLLFFIAMGLPFFLALIAAAAMTHTLPLEHRWRRIGAAFGICLATYVASLFGYLALFGMAQQLLGGMGLRRDADLLNLGSLILGALIAAFGIEGAVAILTGSWSWRHEAGFVAAGLLCVAVATMVPILFHDVYSIAVLFPLGSGLFCGVAGAQLSTVSPPKRTLPQI